MLTDLDPDDATYGPWLASLGDDAPCGEDLEYDNDYLELSQAAAGKPETQFSAAEPPDWNQVLQLAESLNGRSHDLRIAIFWLRARLRRDGLAVLAPTLQLFKEWVSRWWQELHPRLDDGDAYPRVNALAELASLTAALGDVRAAWVLNDRAIGQIAVRDVEIALGSLAPRDDESPMSRDQIEAMLRDAELASDPARDALEALDQLVSALGDNGLSEYDLPDLSGLKDMLRAVSSVMPEGEDSSELDSLLSSDDDDSPAPARRGRGGAPGSIESRADAVKALDAICDYLERNEPTNPAFQLLRRAQRLIDRNFMQLVREFAPDAIEQVARALGVDPETLEPPSSY
jgi:type VI secretion system protein ImpA